MIRSYTSLLLLFLLSITQMTAQCTLSIDAGPDIEICPAEEVRLNASVTGTVLFSVWSPADGLDNPLSLFPTIVEPANTTYRLDVSAFDETANLLINGDFEQGDTGFSSQYESNSNKPEGYLIGKLGTELFPEAKPCEDRTTGSGNMMMAKISETANLNIWCQEVNVKPNTDYYFEAYATGLRTNNPPVILLEINETLLSSGTLGSFACSWQRVRGDWNSENHTTATICLSVSDEDIGAATDFALDDLGFFEVCELSDEVVVKVIPFALETDLSLVQLPCDQSISLSASLNTPANNFSLQWSSPDGNILSGDQSLEPLIDAPGTYVLEAVLEEGSASCREQISIEVEEVSTVDLSIEEPDTLHCQQTELMLSGIHSDTGSGFAYQWSTADGSILSGGDQANVTINAPGRYILTLLELANGCTVSDSVEVFQSRLESFEYELSLPDCDMETGIINITRVEGGTAPYLYGIDPGAGLSADPLFTDISPGEYTLRVQDRNGCQWQEIVILSEVASLSIELESSVILEPGDRYSLNPIVSLEDSLLESIQWSPAIGLSCVDCLYPELLGTQSTTYQLEIVDINACSALASIRVEFREDTEVYVPNAFSPNQDGYNDVFYIQADAAVVQQILRFTIFNRYGSPVFQKENIAPNDASNGWTGIVKGQLAPAGVYVYQAELEFLDGRVAWFKGEVTLLR